MIRVLEKLLTEVVTIIRVEMSKVLIVIGRPTLSSLEILPARQPRGQELWRNGLSGGRHRLFGGYRLARR